MSYLLLTSDKYPLEQLPPGWINAEVSLSREPSSPRRYEIIDARIKEKGRIHYSHEPMRTIAFKCLLLFFFGVPAYFFAYTAFHFIRLPIVTLATLSPTVLCKQIWAIARIPVYFIGLEYAALYGMFHPLEGRALFGRLESALHDGKSRLEATQHENNEAPLKEFWFQSLTEKEHKHAFFVGFCMQPYSSEKSRRNLIVKDLPVPPTA